MRNYIIHLPGNPESTRTANQLRNQLEQFGMEATLFTGTRGDDAVMMMEEEGRVLHPWGIKGPDLPPTDPDAPPHKSVIKAQRPGVRGCFYSHYRLWQLCARLDEPIIIWEDDIVLSRPYMPVEWQDVLIVAIGHPTKSEAYRHYLESPDGVPMAAPYTRTSMPGCCGYAIKPHAARKLLDVYANTFLPADNAINQYHVLIQIHNYIMGRALVEEDGKVSLTSTKHYWRKDVKNKLGK